MKKLFNMFRTRDSHLRKKFENIESELQHSIPNEEMPSQEVANTKNDDFYEEEVLWWGGDASLFETRNADANLGNIEKLLQRVKKTELYYKLSKNDSLAIETVTDKSESYILMTWDSNYLELAERRKFIEQIRHLQIDFRAMGIKVQLVHNHKRLGLSTNIGIKIKVDQVENEKHISTSTNFGENQV